MPKLSSTSIAIKDQRSASKSVELQHRHFAFIANVIAGMSGEAQLTEIACVCRVTGVWINR